MSMRLVALGKGPNILLDKPITQVGRDPQCDTRLSSGRISRRHCCLAHAPGGIRIRDLGSTNGVRINGQRVEEGQVHVGDEVSIAHLRYRLIADSDGAGADVSPDQRAGHPRSQPAEPLAPAIEPPAAAQPEFPSIFIQRHIVCPSQDPPDEVRA